MSLGNNLSKATRYANIVRVFTISIFAYYYIANCKTVCV